MSGWIKLESGTPDKPEVMEIASHLKIDADAVLGKLMRVWVWFDAHSVKGAAPESVEAFLDRLTACTGFADALVKVGWMTRRNGKSSLVNFEKHNGKEAKTRGLSAKRTSAHRMMKALIAELEKEEGGK
jgi:DNA replication protein DnaT